MFKGQRDKLHRCDEFRLAQQARLTAPGRALTKRANVFFAVKTNATPNTTTMNG